MFLCVCLTCEFGVGYKGGFLIVEDTLGSMNFSRDVWVSHNGVQRSKRDQRRQELRVAVM